MPGEVEGEEEATRVESAPWVMTMRRGREVLDLGSEARAMATSVKGASYVSRQSKPKFKRTGGEKTYGHAGGGSIGSGFALVTDQDVNMGQELFKLNLEELGDKGGRQVEGDDLALGGGVLGDFERTLDAVGEKVAFDVKVLGAVDERGNLGLGEVGRGELLGGTEGGAEGTVVAGKNDGAGARLGGGRLDLVGRDDALGFVGLLEGVFEVVVADGADVGDRLGGVDVLCRVSAGGGGKFFVDVQRRHGRRSGRHRRRRRRRWRW